MLVNAAKIDQQKKQAEVEEKRLSKKAEERHKTWLVGKSGQDQYGRYGDLVLENVRQRFRFISAGGFTMGSSKSEQELVILELELGQQHQKALEASEKRQHVSFQQGFWMADTVCTQALWQAVMGNNQASCLSCGH